MARVDDEHPEADRRGAAPPPVSPLGRRIALEDGGRDRFDDVAEATARLTGKAAFFSLCALVVVLWLLSAAFVSFVTWNLVASTVTGVVTFLLVALLQNSQRRAEAAMNEKLNALAVAVADLMRFHSGEDHTAVTSLPPTRQPRSL